PEILLAARVSPTGKFSNLSVTACPVMQGQVQWNYAVPFQRERLSLKARLNNGPPRSTPLAVLRTGSPTNEHAAKSIDGINLEKKYSKLLQHSAHRRRYLS
ncbi:hypothetical protein, partial [Burkholderia gladioli]|uniref:hypothetical protein n=1 Tax=Burkholderia gladioli TaxID=28095 RepID=UPI001ABAAF39